MLKTLDPIRPNLGLEHYYRQRLLKLLDEMNNSILYWIRAAYRRRPPEVHRVKLALDDSPTRDLLKEIRQLSKRWQKKFDTLALDLAAIFTKRSKRNVDTVLASALRKAGWSVKLTLTRAVNDTIQATIAENVSLIKSIPQRYLNEVEGAVMRSVRAGRDLGSLTQELRERYDITRKRAALIARDQNNKATSFIQRTRQLELGIKEAIWVHSTAGKVPRPTHLKAGRDRVRYDLKTGWFDPAEQKYIFPGELINCRCVSRPVLPGLS